MGNNRVINIINFIRAVEPRPGRDYLDLFEPLKEQMKLAKKYNLPTTWLIQYDALLEGPYLEFLKKEMPETHEIGIWFETVQQNVEAAGLKWRGRWSWDWHTDVGFSVGYSPAEREKIADCFVEEFIRRLGYKPKSMGSWLFDAHLLKHLHEKWGISSACNCKDQYGTDGYTLWGGYWANGYYPCKKNAYLPASKEENQIPVPIFRMLGSDPLYQYEAGVGGNGQAVITLEPVYKGIGGDSVEWIDWFMQENFQKDYPRFAMSYAQAGQENSFGWPLMEHGLRYQYKKIAAMLNAGEIRVETLADTGKWFRENYQVTPVSAVVTLEDWKNENRAGIWYMSRFGRINLFQTEKRELIIRDWQIFSDDYAEPFLNSVCQTSDCTYDALPLVDGKLWHPASIKFPGGSGEIIEVQECDDEMKIVWETDNGDRTRIYLSKNAVYIEFDKPGCALIYKISEKDAEAFQTSIQLGADRINYEHLGAKYSLLLENVCIIRKEGEIHLTAIRNSLKLSPILQ